MARSSFVIAIFVTLIGLFHLATAYPHGKDIHVNYPDSIQLAIDSAHGGDKIIVGPGTYKEQLTITTNGLTLVGHDANIVPPDTPVTNTCSGLAPVPGSNITTQAGICIQGSGVVLVPGNPGEHLNVASVVTYVKDTHISGFNVTGFSGLNIAVVGAEDAVVTHNVVSNSARYGILTVGSKNSHIKHDLVISTDPTVFHFIGVCMDDKSTVTIAHNDISGYFIGLCVQTAGADIHDNVVHDVCVGAFVDPGVNGASLHDNHFSNLLSVCQEPFSAGVVISGATNTVVRSNTFSGIKTTEGKAVGVLLIDDSGTGDLASGNDVEKNIFSLDNNLDIFVQTNGTGNVVKRNQCKSSVPLTLCS